MSAETKHKHQYRESEPLKEPLRRYVQEQGKPTPDTMTGFDMLKQRKCKCGAVETYDLERTKI